MLKWSDWQEAEGTSAHADPVEVLTPFPRPGWQLIKGTNNMEVAESDKNETFWLYGDSDDESSLEEPVGDVAEVGTAADQAGPAGQVRTYIRKRSRKRARGGDAVRDGSGKLKKQYLPTTLSAEELAADVAASAGLPDHRLGEHEEGVLNDDIDEEMYFKVPDLVGCLTMCVSACPSSRQHHCQRGGVQCKSA